MYVTVFGGPSHNASLVWGGQRPDSTTTQGGRHGYDIATAHAPRSMGGVSDRRRVGAYTAARRSDPNLADPARRGWLAVRRNRHRSEHPRHPPIGDLHRHRRGLISRASAGGQGAVDRMLGSRGPIGPLDRHVRLGFTPGPR